MTKEASEKIKVILERILTGYTIGREYNYCLGYSVEGLLRDIRMNDSELELILQHLQERKIIENFTETGDDNVIPEPTYTIYFPSDFREKAEGYLSQISGTPVHLSKPNPLEPKKPEIELGKLVAYTDGTIYYDGENLDLRAQLKDLCRLFMQNVGRLVLVDDIKDVLINADKREDTANTTLSKYVSELHTILTKKYKKVVIFNQKKEGWVFSPDRDLDS